MAARKAKKAKKAPAKATRTAKKAAKPAKKAARSAPKKAKAKKVQPIPAGYHTLTPYVVVKGVKDTIEFLKAAVGAKVRYQMAMPDGTVMHAELKIGDSMLMMGECPDGQTPTYTMLYLYVKDTDKAYAQAVKAGGESILTPTNQFYGDRNAAIRDPNGNQWWFGTHVEDVSPKEMARRAADMHKNKTGGA